jgi:hypothetical protein
MNTAAKNFKEFLIETLIPDLIESGRSSDAGDLIKFCEKIDRPFKSEKPREKFAKYLSDRSDELREAGYECSADDFKLASQLMYWDRG